MTALSALRRLPPWGYMLVAAAPLASAYLIEVEGWSDLQRSAIALACVAWGAVFAMLAWFRLDEVAKSAQRWAWLWGGAAGLAAALLSGLALLNAPGLQGWLEIQVSANDHYASVPLSFVYGALFAATAQVAGFLLAWAGWWLAKRGGR